MDFRKKLDLSLNLLMGLEPEERDALIGLDQRIADRSARVIEFQPRSGAAALRRPEEEEAWALGEAAPPRPVVRIFHGVRKGATERTVSALLRFRGDPSVLDALGVKVRSVAGDVAACDLPWSAIRRVAEHPDVLFIEASRPVFPMLDKSLVATGAGAMHAASPPVRGEGVVVGVVDVDGIDCHHPDFWSHNGAAPRSRIARVWDQRAELTGGARAGRRPARFGYGVEYTAVEIEEDARSGEPRSIVPHGPDDAPERLNHATHMAGIAAGNGSASGGLYAGMAPDAELVYVNTVDSEMQGLADIGKLCDAVAYIFKHAGPRPCVVNISLGDNQGPHDGTTLFDRFIDGALEMPGRAVVVAAGNSNDRSQHAHATFDGSGRADLEILVPEGTDRGETIEVWYGRDARLEATLIDPDGVRVGPVPPPEPGGAPRVVSSAIGRARAAIISTVHDGRNGDNAIAIFLQPEQPPLRLLRGAWRLELRRRGGAAAHVDAYIGGNTGARWKQPCKGRSTLSGLGTGRETVVVGNFMVTVNGLVSDTSARGPTRDARRKPDLVAPGAAICAPRGAFDPAARGDTYGRGFGTSQAAAHVTGLIALLFQLYGPLSAADVRALLRRDADSGGDLKTWDCAYGWGRARLRGAGLRPLLDSSISPMSDEQPLPNGNCSL